MDKLKVTSTHIYTDIIELPSKTKMDKLKEEFMDKFCLTATSAELLGTVLPMYMWQDIDSPSEVWQWFSEKLEAEYERGFNDANTEKYIEQKLKQGGKL